MDTREIKLINYKQYLNSTRIEHKVAWDFQDILLEKMHSCHEVNKLRIEKESELDNWNVEFDEIIIIYQETEFEVQEYFMDN